MPLSDFIEKQRGLPKETPAGNAGASSLQKFINSQTKQRAAGPTVKVVPTATPDVKIKVTGAKPASDKKKKTVWRWLGKQLMKPVGMVAAETEELGEFIGSKMAGVDDKYIPGKGALGVLTGKREESFSDVWREHAPGVGISENVAGKIGFAVDIAADPLNFIGGGLTKLGKLASKVTSLAKAGKTVKAGSRLARQIAKAGLTVDDLVLAGTKAEQAKKGQRALLTFLSGTRFEKPLVTGAKAYEFGSKAAQAIGVSKVGAGVRKLFTTKSGTKELDEMVSKYKDLSNYRKQNIIDEAVKIQQALSKMKQHQVKMIVDALENPAVRETVTDQNVLAVTERMQNFFKKLQKIESGKGILKTQIENYFPRIKAKEAIGDRIKHFFSPRNYSAKLPAAKERQVLKLIKETGEEMIGNYRKMGLRKINQSAFRNKLEEAAAKKVQTLQKLLDTLTKDKVNLYTGDLQEVIASLKQNISREPKFGAVADLVEPSASELDDIVKSIVNPKRDELELLIKDLEKLVQTSQGKEFFKPTLGFRNSKNAKIKWAYDEIIKAQNKLTEDLQKIGQFDFVDQAGKFYKRGVDMTHEINQYFGKDFFETNPAIAFAQRGLASAKAVTAKEFLDDVAKKFFVNAEDAPLNYIASTNPILKGLKADPEIVRVVDQYVEGIKPDDLKVMIRAYDKMQNWWKAQALISPSYHLRNMASNFWNNWLAGVKNPVRYEQARRVQSNSQSKLDDIILLTDAGEKYTRRQLKDLARKHGVTGRGWYGADIERMLEEEVKGATVKLKDALPWTQENLLFRGNKVIGSAIEDNARLAHFLDKLKVGFSPEDAAKSVKKFLFDYEDLSKFEKNVMKRIMPFYTWSRKNLPLQLENLIIQPEKFAMIPKAIKEIESGVPAPESEKYMSEYITQNIPVRIRTNDRGGTEYFLLGNWLPAAQAVDFLSQPLENIMSMTTPFVKTPIELWSNRSFFFKNTLGEPSKIEYYYRQPTDFAGMTVRRKTAHLFRNIRILSDIHKLTRLPTQERPEESWQVKLLNLLFGKAATYDVKKARYFYQRDTEQRVREIKQSIKKAKKMGQKEHAKELVETLRAFKKKRGR